MQVAATIAQLRQIRRSWGAGHVGFVPTMGALHAGHRSLADAARAANPRVIASIFVNPTQFGPKEDFGRYPRTLDADSAMLEEVGVDLLFAPEPQEMYPQGFATAVDVGPVATRLDGASRPGHFTGVATVVAKLFGIVEPDRAYFGQKDAAQVAVLRRLVLDLSLPVELVVCPTVREPDGLALSSRNRYLSPDERKSALVLSRALFAAEQAAKLGEISVGTLLAAARTVLAKEPAIQLDYLTLVNPDTLLPMEVLVPGSPSLLAVAGWVGVTRLIDNVLLAIA